MTMLELTPFDLLDHIKTPADIAEWLEVQLEGDHTVDEMRAGVLVAIKALRRLSGQTQ